MEPAQAPGSSPPAQVPASPPVQVGLEDALFMIGQTQESIRHADNKIGLLFAASTVLLGALATSWSSFRSEVDVAGGAGWFAAACFGAAMLGLAVSYALMVGGLAPRTRELGQAQLPPVHDNRFAWPSVAAMSIDELESLSQDVVQVRREALLQMKALASIAAVKFRMFRRSLELVVISGALFIVSQVLTRR